MTVLLSDVGCHARLNLTFSSQRGRTIIRESYCEVPFKITRLHDATPDGIAHLILMHSTAGVFGGDVLESTIHVEAGARVLITQQSAAKVHPSGSRCAVQRNRIHVEADGELHILNDPIIPFAESRLRQITSIDLDHKSRFCFWESFMAGRLGYGEIWQFDELSSETYLRVSGDLLHLERFCLKPKQERPTAEWVMASSRYFATGISFDARAIDRAESLRQAMPSAGVDTPTPGLVIVRVAACDGPTLHRHRQAFAHAGGVEY
jgi:urease accessory protein UreH